MKVPYNQEYFPSAPVLVIHLAVSRDGQQLVPYSALIDTGADGTLIPTSLLETLEAPVEYTAVVRPHVGGAAHEVSVYEVDILFDTTRLPSIAVVGDDQEQEIILGRNVLNKLRLLLDGPQGVTDVSL